MVSTTKAEKLSQIGFSVERPVKDSHVADDPYVKRATINLYEIMFLFDATQKTFHAIDDIVRMNMQEIVAKNAS